VAERILTMHFGPQDVLVALSLDFVDSRTAAEVEQAVTRIERRIKAAHPEVTRSLRPRAVTLIDVASLPWKPYREPPKTLSDLSAYPR
jgi:hypothetical protein